jgi:beta-lactamase class A
MPCFSTASRLRLVGIAATVLAVLGCSSATEVADPSGATTLSSTTSTSTTIRSAGSGSACLPDQEALVSKLEGLEASRDALVGVYAVDTDTRAELAYRADERFAFASTGKALLAAVVLDELTTQQLSRRLRWTEADLVPYSPVTELHVEDGLTVREVLEAAVTISDNTAANLLFDLIGGPRGLDRALEEIGDSTTEVVRREPELNDWRPGEVRDTTTPRAVAESLAAFAVGGELATPDKRLLNRLLLRNTTGDALIRSAVPQEWRVGDKTGSATYGTRNDIAVLTPPGRAPVVLAVLTRHEKSDAPTDDALVAGAAKAVVDALCVRPGDQP